MGAAWGIVVVGMLAVLLVVFVLRLRRSSAQGSGRMVAIGVVAGLLVAGIAFLAQQTG